MNLLQLKLKAELKLQKLNSWNMVKTQHITASSYIIVNEKPLKKINNMHKQLKRVTDYEKNLPIVEIYTAVQSEGSRAGYPTVVIRTTGCTHRCFFGEGGWCDSWYTSIHPEKGHFNFKDIIKAYKDILASPKDFCFIDEKGLQTAEIAKVYEAYPQLSSFDSMRLCGQINTKLKALYKGRR